MLWLCALLALTASTFLLTSRADGLLTRQRVDLARARAAADAGVALVLIGVSGAAPEGPWPRDGRVVNASFGGADLHLSAQDELGLIDLNQASAEIFAGLFHGLGASESESLAAAASIVGWRDPNGAPRRQITEVDDLGRLPGLPLPVLRRALPFLTVRNGTAAVDPVTAPGPVLRALPGVQGWVADTMIAARSLASVLPGSLPLLNDPTLQGPPPHRFAMIRSEGQVASGVKFVREAEVELRPDGDTAYRMLVWRQSTPGLAQN